MWRCVTRAVDDQGGGGRGKGDVCDGVGGGCEGEDGDSDEDDG